MPDILTIEDIGIVVKYSPNGIPFYSYCYKIILSNSEIYYSTVDKSILDSMPQDRSDRFRQRELESYLKYIQNDKSRWKREAQKTP